MKSFLIAACVLLLAVAQASTAVAKELAEYRKEADQYYDAGNFKKAYKGYLKVAKIGDQYSQYWVSHMFANGEGRKVDLEDAYAWSVLAAESGDEKLLGYSADLLEQNADKAAAQKAQEMGLGVNAGHDLNLQNLGKFLSGCPEILEVSIGHALIVESLELGLESVVKKYVEIVQG